MLFLMTVFWILKGLSFWAQHNYTTSPPFFPTPLPLLNGTTIIEQPAGLDTLVTRYVERARCVSTCLLVYIVCMCVFARVRVYSPLHFHVLCTTNNQCEQHAL